MKLLTTTKNNLKRRVNCLCLPFVTHFFSMSSIKIYNKDIFYQQINSAVVLTGLIACNLSIYACFVLFCRCIANMLGNGRRLSFINISFVALGCSGSFSEDCKIHSVPHALLSRVRRVLLLSPALVGCSLEEGVSRNVIDSPLGLSAAAVARSRGGFQIVLETGFLECSETVLKQPIDPARACHLAQLDFPAP